ncbi:hypothetical protein CR513_50537 [Mucuna pruriens]|uniref:Uncharacterized protein n=1 Tax=Mucuna pruriens TaxID=157652 RepID=A0A371EW48_MUCPR|nr:hypothetical protein CR513_50537 [Mucuna pruriens]
MSRRPVNPSRRFGDSGGRLFSSSKSRSSPVLSVGLIIVGGLFLIGYVYKGSGLVPGGFGSRLESVSRVESDYLCTSEVQRAIPILQKAYGDSLHKVLHVGPDTCYVVSKLLKEEETEAWGIEPYDIEDADGNCKALIRKGTVRMADIKFPLPYRPKSFSLVIVSDALDFLSPRYLNKTLPDLARVSSDGIVIFTGFPDNHKAKVADVSKVGRAAKMRSSSWWVRFFLQINLEENETASKKFAQALTKSSHVPRCQIFHLNACAEHIVRILSFFASVFTSTREVILCTTLAHTI